MGSMKRVTVVLDRQSLHSDAGIDTLGAGSDLASAAGARLTAVALGVEADEAAGLASSTADDVVSICAPWLSRYDADLYVAALAEACRELGPDLLLLPHDAASREVAPRLAARLGASLVTDCTSLRSDPESGDLFASRPCFSGKASGEWAMPAGRLKVVTLRRQSGRALPGSAPGPCTLSTLTLSGEPRARVRVVDRVLPPPGQVRLEDAEVVVGVGRGVGSREAFEEHFLGGLAPALGAACGGSRGAVDMGIIPADLQIGLTGRVVSPQLYIAVGLSGSPQHMAGCSGARTIVAVNTDPGAPIFSFAHHGIVGDYRRVVPALAARLRELQLAAI